MPSTLPSDWHSRRRAVYRRDDYTCRRCGRRGGPDGTTSVHVHHVDPDAEDGRHRVANLEPLCRECYNAALRTETKTEPADSKVGNLDAQLSFIQDIEDISSAISEFKADATGSLETIRGLSETAHPGEGDVNRYLQRKETLESTVTRGYEILVDLAETAPDPSFVKTCRVYNDYITGFAGLLFRVEVEDDRLDRVVGGADASTHEDVSLVAATDSGSSGDDDVEVAVDTFEAATADLRELLIKDYKFVHSNK